MTRGQENIRKQNRREDWRREMGIYYTFLSRNVTAKLRQYIRPCKEIDREREGGGRGRGGEESKNCKRRLQGERQV